MASSRSTPTETGPGRATMRALVHVADGHLEVTPTPRPQPGPHEVLVEVGRCGICGTDIHLVLEGYARPGSVLGHEWSGRIAALGTDVTGWEIGDRVTAGPEPGCGDCRACRRGRPSVCRHRQPPDYLSFRGAFAEYVVAEAARLVAVPDEVDDRAAALTEPLAVALHGCDLGDPRPGDRVLVTGAGPLGLLVVAALRTRGLDDITVSEPSALRREQAVAAGARATVTPDALPAPPMGEPVAEPYDVAFECSGHASAATAALEQLDRAGTLVLLGTGAEHPRFNHNRMIVLETDVVGSYNYGEGGFEAALALLASGTLPVEALLDPADVGLDEVGDAIRACAEGRRRAKVLVDPSRTGGPP